MTIKCTTKSTIGYPHGELHKAYLNQTRPMGGFSNKPNQKRVKPHMRERLVLFCYTWHNATDSTATYMPTPDPPHHWADKAINATFSLRSLCCSRTCWWPPTHLYQWTVTLASHIAKGLNIAETPFGFCTTEQSRPALLKLVLAVSNLPMVLSDYDMSQGSL